jgi:hypothetical protein
MIGVGRCKEIISVVITHNDEVIDAKRRCKITLKDFQNVYAMIATQLIVVEKALQTAL